jgi:hypothetical protein
MMMDEENKTQVYISLGKVTYWAAEMELMLRDTFSGLVGSKFAAIPAARQNAGALIIQCKSLIAAHTEMPKGHRDALEAALDLCAAANAKRNTLIHGVKFIGHDGTTGIVQRISKKSEPEIISWSLPEIQEAVENLEKAAKELFGAALDALGPGIDIARKFTGSPGLMADLGMILCRLCSPVPSCCGKTHQARPGCHDNAGMQSLRMVSRRPRVSPARPPRGRPRGLVTV